MALKAKLNEDQYKALSADLQKEYKKHGDEYVLDLEGAEDTAALEKKRSIEAEHRKKAEAKIKELEKEIAKIRDDAEAERDTESKKKGDIEALTKSWEQKLAKKEAELKAELDRRDKALQELLVDREAMSIASSLAIEGSAEILLPHLKSRLRAEIVDGKPTTKVVDEAGNPSASSLKELMEEIRAKPAFAPIIVGSKANGGGAKGGKGGGGTSITKLADFKTKTEEAKFANENPEAYARLLSGASSN